MGTSYRAYRERLYGIIDEVSLRLPRPWRFRLELACVSALLAVCLLLKLLLAQRILLPQEAAWANLPGLMQNYFYAALQYLEMPVFELPFSPMTWMPMAWVLKLFGASNGLYKVGLFLGLVTTSTFAALYLYMRKAFGVPVALVALALLAFSRSLNFYGITVSKHVMSMFFLSLALLGYAYLRGGLRAAAVGSASALMFASFEFNIFYVPLLALGCLFSGRGRAGRLAWLALAFTLTLSPFIARNYSINGLAWDIPWSEEWVVRQMGPDQATLGLEESYIARGYDPRTAHLFYYSSKRKELARRIAGWGPALLREWVSWELSGEKKSRLLGFEFWDQESGPKKVALAVLLILGSCAALARRRGEGLAAMLVALVVWRLAVALANSVIGVNEPERAFFDLFVLAKTVFAVAYCWLAEAAASLLVLPLAARMRLVRLSGPGGRPPG